QSYAKGLGVHANSSITYNLNSHYTSFLSDIGVDDEVGSAGSVDFQVYLDKVKVYDSGVMTNSTKTKSIKLDVTGKKSLQLVVTDGGNGNASDHADWANARLVPASSTAVKKSTSPPPPTSNPLSTTTVPATGGWNWLSDLNWTSMTNGWGPAEKNESNGDKPANDGTPITLNGKVYAKGLGVHANSSISYNLNGKYKKLSTDIGVDDAVGNVGSVDFEIFLDDVKVFDSGKMTGSSASKWVGLDLAGKKTLTLVVTDGGDGNASDHADWAGAKIM
ncbi:MAG TPA: NPCBM/NEW2 domain-containing protein, partial [Tepidisphaeraceae bacterium]|nr:NPCBM/NEW2 domain-containing protein [Tepidisphaeraceae bacterium]